MKVENRQKFNMNRTVRLIIEQTNESVDFGDFIDEVVNFKETKEEVGVNKGPFKNEE